MECPAPLRPRPSIKIRGLLRRRSRLPNFSGPPQPSLSVADAGLSKIRGGAALNGGHERKEKVGLYSNGEDGTARPLRGPCGRMHGRLRLFKVAGTIMG